MYITYVFLVVTILISLKGFNDKSFTQKWVLNPYDVVHNKKWYRIFTHAFIHADAMHLGFNMYVLYMFGVQVIPSTYYTNHYSLEPQFVIDFGVKGYFYYFLLYVGGIAFSSMYSLHKYKDTPNYNSLGASGAVSAVIFSYMIVNPTAELGIILIPFYLPAYIFGPLMLLFEYIMAKRGGSHIAHEAHLSGAIFGLIFTIAIHPAYVTKLIETIF